MQRLNLSCLLLSVHALLPAPITCPPAHPMLSPNMPAPQHSTQRTHLEDLDQLQLAAALQLKALRSAGRKEGVRKRAEGRHSKQVSKPWIMACREGECCSRADQVAVGRQAVGGVSRGGTGRRVGRNINPRTLLHLLHSAKCNNAPQCTTHPPYRGRPPRTRCSSRWSPRTGAAPCQPASAGQRKARQGKAEQVWVEVW